MADTKSINLMGLVGVLGAIILIVGVFLSWVDVTFSAGIFGSETESFSGINIADYEHADELAYSYAPIIALAAGIISLIACALPIFMQNETLNKVLGIVSLILAIVTIVIMFLFMGEWTADATYEGFGATIEVGIGFWLCMVGAIITALGGVLDIIKK